uniref:TBC1 domain family member 5 n=1 Tax=Oryzias sinensis TaxID=183150 RepID=A0A8C8DPH8_9TELE
MTFVITFLASGTFCSIKSFVNKPPQRTYGSSTGSERASSFFGLCLKEWNDLFLHSNYLARIRQAGISGRLRSSRFRSVCWKLYLEVLPEDKGQWINKTNELRAQYEKIKEMHIINPRKAAGQQDLVVNNPLSQDEGSLWNKFFQDKELKGMIKQDVFRTFPEIRYFQDDDVRTKLTDILFCYARENEQLLYKQGMHELLAPIVFVLHCDHQTFQHASETASPSEEMKCLLNPMYLEHDEEMLSSIPFARPQDAGPSVAIVTKVNRIQDQLVKKHDTELHMHLNRLEIAPQIYGIRWVRLLFGREFPLQDLLVVWDALFADSITLDLVDYVFVAMLLYIRNALTANNFQTCLGLLMHYPPVEDINALLQKALFLRDPKNNQRPVNYQFQQNLDYYKTRGTDLMNKTRSSSSAKPPLNINKVSSSLLNLGRKLISPAMPGASTGISPINSEVHPPSSPSSVSPGQHYRLLKSESMPVHLSKGEQQGSLPAQAYTDTQGQNPMAISSSPSIESLPGGRSDVSTSSPPPSATKKDSFFNITRSRSHSKTMGRKETDEDFEGQISFLQGQINDLEAMSKYCAKMMNSHICKIQDVILQEHLQREDEVLVSLAGLKQIKDILKGSLRFNQSQLEAEENEEITIADDHYTTTAAAGVGAEEPTATPPEQEVHSFSPGKNWDDYILVSQDGDLQAEGGGKGASERSPSIRRERGMVRIEPEGASGTFHNPLMVCTTSGSSSPDEGSTNSKDSDFTIVNPSDL